VSFVVNLRCLCSPTVFNGVQRSVWVVELLSLALRKAGEIGNRCIRSQRGSNALLEIRRFPGSKWRLKKINIFGALGPDLAIIRM
jgi:hypothetical protein